MKIKLLAAAALAALSIGATGAQAAPAVSATDIVTQSNDSAVQPAYYGYRYYYYYQPYYYYYYPSCWYNRFGYYVCR